MSFNLYESIPDEEFNILTRIETRYNYLFEYGPKFEWYNLYPQYKNLNDMRRPDNKCGYIQRMLESNIAIKSFLRTGGRPGLSLCSGQAPALFCVTNDLYHTDNHPVYGGSYKPMIVHDAAKLPFLGTDTWPFIVANHGLEHLPNTVDVLREWIRICTTDGLILAIMPDSDYVGDHGGGDESHESVYSAREFKTEVLPQIQDQVFVDSFDTLQNHFSFEVLLRKKRF